MRFLGKRKSVALALFAMAVSLGIPLSVLALFGGSVKIPTASQMATEIEQRYNLNLGSIQNMGQGFNVSSQKVVAPEVSLFFSPTDPKPGEKVQAKAFPMFFSNPESQLYFTWYLKRDGCDLGTAAGKPAECDADGNGSITVNDWKVIAARIIAQNGYDNATANYGASTDDDGYRAKYGGDLEVDRPTWCYVYDSQDGRTYELTDGAVDGTFQCAGGLSPTCVMQNSSIGSGDQSCTFDPILGTTVCTGDTFTETLVDEYYIVGTPTCSTSGTASCTYFCLDSNLTEPFTLAELGTAYTTCSYVASSTAVGAAACDHLFPDPRGTGETTGDDNFGADEEQFWGTDPADPDTSDNGNKDEANIVGLGNVNFEWNYLPGDMVGVAVEGVSMIPTKHDDSSMMIMWGFSQNDCPVTGKGSYSMNVKGYLVTFPTSSMDLNDCLPDNLVDPTEGGQAKRLEVKVTYTPDNPVNDRTAEKFGDTLAVTAAATNSNRPSEELRYDWRVEVSASPSFTTGINNITDALLAAGLIPGTGGIGMATLPISLNMDAGFLNPYGLATTDPIYLRVTATLTENFAAGVSRTGKSDVIVKVANTDKKILAYNTDTYVADATIDPARIEVTTADLICDQYFPDPTTESEVKENLNRIACRVIKNEIVGVYVDPTGLADFHWSINDVPLPCSQEVVSNQCAPDGAENNYAFFAVAADAGETYTVRVSATDIVTGKAVELSRLFQVVDPEGVIEPADTTNVWPKILGTYTDIDGIVYDDIAPRSYETYPGATMTFDALSFPSWVIDFVSSYSWTLDGEVVVIDGNITTDNPAVTVDPAFPMRIMIRVDKLPTQSYILQFGADILQDPEKRQALEQIWKIGDFESAELRLEQTVSIDVLDPLNEDLGSNIIATVSKYLPVSVMLGLRLMLSIGIVVLIVAFVHAFIPETTGEEVILSRRDD